jgi:hypothetical protein
MNERIKELMGQTLDEKFAGTWSVMDLQDLTKFADRFAELIVEECVGVSDDYVRGCLCEEHKNIKRPRSTIGRKIREHFGVEV